MTGTVRPAIGTSTVVPAAGCPRRHGDGDGAGEQLDCGRRDFDVVTGRPRTSRARWSSAADVPASASMSSTTVDAARAVAHDAVLADELTGLVEPDEGGAGRDRDGVGVERAGVQVDVHAETRRATRWPAPGCRLRGHARGRRTRRGPTEARSRPSRASSCSTASWLERSPASTPAVHSTGRPSRRTCSTTASAGEERGELREPEPSGDTDRACEDAKEFRHGAAA